MTMREVSDMKAPIGEILQAAGTDGLLLETAESARYAVIPLDDDLIDYINERSPKLIEQCPQIRQRMHADGYQSHDAVKALLGHE